METVVLDLPENSMLSEFQIVNGHYITFEEYLGMNVAGAYLEWEDGKVIGFMSNNLRHQIIIGFLMTVMKVFAEVHNLGEVVQAGYAMKLEAQRRGREPDLVFVSKENAKILKFEYLDGAADIAVEIVSPESVERDRETKFGEYEAAGVKEYWLIDPQLEEAEFYQLNDTGEFQRVEAAEGVFRSTVLPGFFLRVTWLWQEKPPTVAALKELQLI